jgi:hypothetical protein
MTLSPVEGSFDRGMTVSPVEGSFDRGMTVSPVEGSLALEIYPFARGTSCSHGMTIPREKGSFCHHNIYYRHYGEAHREFKS